MADPDVKGGVTITFDAKTIITVISIVLGLGAAGYGGLGSILTRDVPTNTSVQDATSSIVGELRQLRREMNSLQALRYQVEDHARAIDSLKQATEQTAVLQQKGFGALWEQNKIILEELSDR